MLEKLKQLVVEEKGQGMVEYGLILALIAVVVIFALGQIGEQTEGVFSKVQEELSKVTSGGGDS
ncbi:MAG: Flp family type IVb pilin [Syntrophomonadaceae bacterium]|nr:Flp family type IVb pilin [Syntrophomonadaceae bacterium]